MTLKTLQSSVWSMGVECELAAMSSSLEVVRIVPTHTKIKAHYGGIEMRKSYEQRSVRCQTARSPFPDTSDNRNVEKEGGLVKERWIGLELESNDTSDLRIGANKAAVSEDYIVHLHESLRDGGGGPLHWFASTLASERAENAPLLLFLPEVVGTGLGFAMQQENLVGLFELRCLVMPALDRTPFEGLVTFVEETVRDEARLQPRRPIYLVGESFGGALALAVASRSPQLNLVLVLVNPSTALENYTLQPLVPLLQALPSELFPAVPMLLGLMSHDPVLSASQLGKRLLPSFVENESSLVDVGSMLRLIADVVQSLPAGAFSWKLNLLETGARYANSRLQAVKADVMILASEKDQLLPSVKEAKRLTKILKNAEYRILPEGGHALLAEQGINLATVIKSTGIYRRTDRKDLVSDFVPPTREEVNKLVASNQLMRNLLSPVFFSSGDDGRVVTGLSKVPGSKKPLIFVGNHTMYGMDMALVFTEVLKELNILPRGLAHPILFDDAASSSGDRARLFGAVSVSGKNMFKLLARGETILLYPGGAREALHRKGEWHQLFWPDRPEIIRMAARFGATLIPMCSVGLDDVFELLLDFDDLINLPIVGGQILETFDKLPKWRQDSEGDVGNQTPHTPILLPKISGPGRVYVLFGKPICTEGREAYFRDHKNVRREYDELKLAVENGIAYLLKKREEDPYRGFISRFAYEMTSAGKQAPTFEP